MIAIKVSNNSEIDIVLQELWASSNLAIRRIPYDPYAYTPERERERDFLLLIYARKISIVHTYRDEKKLLVRLIGTLTRCCRDTNWRWHPQNHRLPYGAAHLNQSLKNNE